MFQIHFARDGMGCVSRVCARGERAVIHQDGPVRQTNFVKQRARRAAHAKYCRAGVDNKLTAVFRNLDCDRRRGICAGGTIGHNAILRAAVRRDARGKRDEQPLNRRGRLRAPRVPTREHLKFRRHKHIVCIHERQRICIQYIQRARKRHARTHNLITARDARVLTHREYQLRRNRGGRK